MTPQDLVANTIYINFLGAYEKLDGEKSQKVLYFESPMTRKDPDRVSGPDCWRVELVEPEVRGCGTRASAADVWLQSYPCELAYICLRCPCRTPPLRPCRANGVACR